MPINSYFKEVAVEEPNATIRSKSKFERNSIQTGYLWSETQT